MPPDVLYRVRGSIHNYELRYSLRGLANLEHGEVWLVGRPPRWLHGMNVIPGGHYRTKWHGLVGDLLLACERLPGRTMWLIDDDFYVLAPMTIPVAHKGSLLKHSERASGAYKKSLYATHIYLLDHGIAEPLSYELHIPMVIDTDKMAEVLRPVATQPLQARSLYGNLAHIGGEWMGDVKMRGDRHVPKGDLVSSNGWLREMMPKLQAALPKPSQYE